MKGIPDLMVYVYSSIETEQADIDRVQTVLGSLSIRNMLYVSDLSIRCLSDEELRQWVQNEKSRGTNYANLYNKLAQQGMSVSDCQKQWYIVKEVFGVK